MKNDENPQYNSNLLFCGHIDRVMSGVFQSSVVYCLYGGVRPQPPRIIQLYLFYLTDPDPTLMQYKIAKKFNYQQKYSNIVIQAKFLISIKLGNSSTLGIQKNFFFK